MTSTRPIVAALAITLVGSMLLVACGKDGVTTYEAPRDGDSADSRASASREATAPPAATAADPGAGISPEASAPATGDQASGDQASGDRASGGRASGDRATGDRAGAIDPEAPWQVPDGWSVSETRAPMRHATLQIDDEGGPIEVAITRFPGDVGGMLANVNRWRGQVGLPPVGEDELPAMLERFSNPGFEGATLHVRGPNGDMLVASIHETAAHRTWFVRVIADPGTVDRVKPEVFEFARTFGRTDADPAP